MNKEILLNNSDYFEIEIGKRILITDLHNKESHKIFGKLGLSQDDKHSIPVYSSNVNKIYGYAEKSNLYLDAEKIVEKFDKNHVLWGIDGNFEFNIKQKGEKFGTTDHCGTIKILNQNILPEYLLYQLELKKHELGFDRTLRSSISNMESVSVDVPFTDNNKVDIITQKEIVSKYNIINDIKNQFDSELSELENAEIELNEEFTNMKEFSVSEIFDFPETNSGITKDFCQENKGTIPVYGCSKSENITLGYIKPDLKKVKYYQDCLTWNRNGSVGYFFLRKGKFATNEDHRTLKIKNKYLDKIHLPYVRYILQNSVKKLGYNFSNKLGKEKISTITIQIPMTEDGVMDLTQQEETAEIYEKIYAVKKGLVDNLQIINESIIAI